MKIFPLLLAVAGSAEYYVAMHHISRHLRVAIITITAVATVSSPLYAAATTAVTPTQVLAATPSLLITEFQTNGGSASQEFVEIYNTTDQDIDFSANTNEPWKLQFFSATSVKTGSPVWTTTPTAGNSLTLSGVVAAHDYYLLASKGYAPSDVQPDQVYDATSAHLMTDTGGGLQLLHAGAASATSPASQITVHDRVMWLAQTASAGLSASMLPSPAVKLSLQRVPDEDGEYVATPGVIGQFDTADEITPLHAWAPPAPIVPEVIVAPQPDADEATTNPTEPVENVTEPATSVPTQESTPAVVSNAGLIAPHITELMPNPASPLTDTADEYIELYNPNDAAFDLAGYSLEVGTTTLHSYTFGQATILPARSYLAVYVTESKLALSNTAGQARLKNTTDVLVDQATAYMSAGSGNSWSLLDGIWQWTATPTPGAANIYAPLVTKTTATAKATAEKLAAAKAATAVAKETATKKATAAKTKGVTTTKKAVIKQTAPKKTTAKKTAVQKTAIVAATTATKPKPPIHSGILVAVAVAAVLYGMYEYRRDIGNALVKLRNNRIFGISDRRQASWR